MLNFSWQSFGDSATNISQKNVTTSQPLFAVAVGTLTWWTVIISALQWLMFVVGTGGNLIVLLVLIWNRSGKQLVTQLFVGSLSVADLVLLLSTGWIQGLLFIQNNWTFGQLFCKIQTTLLATCGYTSEWTLVALSLDR
jgi:tachykinin receptor 3